MTILSGQSMFQVQLKFSSSWLADCIHYGLQVTLYHYNARDEGVDARPA